MYISRWIICKRSKWHRFLSWSRWMCCHDPRGPLQTSNPQWMCVTRSIVDRAICTVYMDRVHKIQLIFMDRARQVIHCGSCNMYPHGSSFCSGPVRSCKHIHVETSHRRSGSDIMDYINARSKWIDPNGSTTHTTKIGPGSDGCVPHSNPGD